MHLALAVAQNNSALMQLGRSILVFYPLITLTMLLMANAEVGATA
jgi:hypothetical protein